jgi:hyperosmotically inducible protein
LPPAFVDSNPFFSDANVRAGEALRRPLRRGSGTRLTFPKKTPDTAPGSRRHRIGPDGAAACRPRGIIDRRRNQMRLSNLVVVFGLLAVGLSVAGCPAKSVIDYAIEARSAEDIAKDNEIVFDVNKIMVDLGTIKASTEIYEQRLLVTGLFDDQALYDDFQARVSQVEDVKKLYWHATYMSEADQEKNEANLMDWDDALILDNKIGIHLFETKGVADVNFRVTVDSFGTVYLLGRARSQEELNKTIGVATETEGTRKVVSYVEVRP